MSVPGKDAPLQDRLIPTAQPSVLLVIETFGAIPFVHLHLESRRRFYPDVPVIVHDGGSVEAEGLQEMCVAYGAHLFSPRASLEPDSADLSAALLAIQSARQLGLDLAVKMSRAFVPFTNWVPQLQDAAYRTQYATYGCPGEDVGLRSECIAFHAASWASGDFEARMEQAIHAGPPGVGPAGNFLHDLARVVQAGARSEAHAAFERLYPREPSAGGYGDWPWLGLEPGRPRSSFLWREADSARDYHRLAVAYGMSYRYEDYLGPGETLDARDTPQRTSPRAVAKASDVIRTAPHEARVFTHDRGDFRTVADANVLIYLPHGFGDWVHFSRILPLLDPSNRYYMTRFGDDTISVMEGNEFVAPLYGGHNSPGCDDGGVFEARHFGLDYEQMDGSRQALELPLSLSRRCRDLEIDVLLWTDLPDPWGSRPFPFHTKARHLLPFLVSEERLRQTDLAAPLPSTIRFESSPWLTRWVESRLATVAGFGERKLCLITRNGYTTIGKNWGHFFRDDVPYRTLREGQECRDFMRLLLRKDPRWMFLVMEDQLYEGNDTMRSQALHAYSYAEVFGTSGAGTVPFGLVLKVLVNLASLSVGIPAGPYHLSMAKDGLPTVGLWIEQLPTWYDEPRPDAIHLISRNVREMGADQRPGSLAGGSGPAHQMRWLDTRRIPGEQVLSAVETLLS